MWLLRTLKIPRMPYMAEMYNRTYLTENEHYVVEDLMRGYCLANGLELKYYRKIKTGHEPCWREFKVVGDRGKLLKMVEEEQFKTAIDDSWRRSRSLAR